jgi:hypothetical protein
MAPTWLTTVGWVYLSICFACAGAIGYDIAVNRRRQPMGVMNAVYPITALYFGPLALAFYWRWARAARPAPARAPAPAPAPRQGKPGKPRWAVMATEVSHCGSGCVLGDVISEFVIFALALGIVFQYFAIAPMRGLGVRDGLRAAAKADVISLTAFEVGLFGWMAVMAFVLFPAPHQLMPNSAAFWFLMQIGMIIGFATSWPANVWLVNRGIKVPM